MKAFQITGPYEYRFTDDLPKPVPAEGEVLLQVLKVGYCGSDLNTFRGKNPVVSYPRIPVHEVVARIAETRPETPAELKVGDVVTLLPYTNCGKCMSCLDGRTNACKDNQTLGVQRDGALTEYMAVPYEKLLTNIEGLSLHEIGLVEPLAVGYHAAERGEIGKGDFTLIFGCGLVGLGVIARAAELGGRVIAVDIVDEKLETAKQVGAEFTINSASENLEERVAEITSGFGAKVVVEAIGFNETFRAAVDLVSFAGRIVYVGYAGTPVEYETKYFVMKEIQIRGARNADRKDFFNVLETLKTGKIPAEKLITDDLPLDQAGKAIEMWNEDPGRVTKLLITVGEA